MNRRNDGFENENGLQFENAVCNLTSMSEGSMRAKVCVCFLCSKAFSSHATNLPCAKCTIMHIL